MTRTVLTLPVLADDGDVRLDRWLKRKFPTLTQAQIEKWVRTGQVRVDGARAKANQRLHEGVVVRVPPVPPAPPPRAPGGVSEKDAAFVRSLILHKDDDVIVLNKPAGLAVQGGVAEGEHIDRLLPALCFEREERPKLVHRLDKDTSGCLVLARHPRAAAHLAAQFRARETEKIYWAVVVGTPRPAAGELRCWMRKAFNERNPDRETMQPCRQQDEGAVHAVTQYHVVSDAGGRAAWVALRPITGRTHQLRFHMAQMGYAIVGDRKYTSRRETPGGLDPMLHLHARAIRMPHPSGGVLTAEAPMPPHMARSFAALGFRDRDVKDAFAGFGAAR